MSSNPNVNLSASAGVQCLIPLIYFAWADQVLSPTEIHLLKEKANQLPFLTKSDKVVLQNWTNPRQPPSRELFKYWEIKLKETIESYADKPPKPNLVAIGVALAKKSAQRNGQDLDWLSTKNLQLLQELEVGLSQINLNTYQNLLSIEEDNTLLIAEAPKGQFEIDKMTQLLDWPNATIRQRMRQLLKDPIFKLSSKPIKEDHRAWVLECCYALATQGLGDLSFPEEYGGKNRMVDYTCVFEMLGYHDLSLAIKFGVQFGLFGGSVFFLGTKKHHDKYLKSIGTLELPGCFAMTETGHGSNVRGLETTAIYNSEDQTITINSPTQQAGKEYIGNALDGKMATVFAQLIVDGQNHGVHAVLVPLRDDSNQLLPGIKVEDCGYKLGLNGVDNGRIWFNQVNVPIDNLLNRFGNVSLEGKYSSPIENPSRRFFTMLGTLVGGRVCVPRAGLSATKTGLTIAIKYSLKRRQFAPNFNEPETLILDYPSHQRRLLPKLAKTYALHFGLDYLTERYINRSEEDIREIETLAAGMKAYATDFTTKTLQECREACGGKGYLAENRFAALKADSDIFTTFEGDNTVLLQLVAKGLLSEFQKEFHEDGTWAVLRYVGTRVSTVLSEQNPFIIRNTDREHLLDTDFHLSAFQYRERRLLQSLARRLRGWIKEGLTSHAAFLKCQNHSIELAIAYIERVILEQFALKIASTEDKNLKATLKDLCDLFALSTMDEYKGWYLEHDYLAGSKTKAIRRMTDELCSLIRKNASALVDAFAIPNESLSAPIIVGKIKKEGQP